MPKRSMLKRGAALRQGSNFLLGAGLIAVTALAAQAQLASTPAPVEPSVFGTVALPAGTTPTSARWTRIMAARVDHPALASLTDAAATLGREQQAAYVQAAVNRAVQPGGGCRSDDGYWATAEETLTRRAGDCVDIAVAKMEALRRLGFAQSDLYLTTGRSAGGGFKSALLVRIGENFWLLDDRSDGLTKADAPAGFDPALTYGVGMTWAHGRRLASQLH